jgi:hypothetical protein
LSEAVFAVGPVAEHLRITEIMYHPRETGEPEDPNAEYIELRNIGLETLALNFVEFTDGIRFTFGATRLEPGGYVLVVKDLLAFESRYGPGHEVAGQYAGSLDNGGERIRLADAAGQVIHDFRYADSWYPTTDGRGYSLTLRDPVGADATKWGSAALWRPSRQIGGSPGTDD